MTSTKGFVFIKSDVFIAVDAGKQGGFVSLSFRNNSVNSLACLDLICKDIFLEKNRHIHTQTDKQLAPFGTDGTVQCPNSAGAESRLGR